MYTAKVLRCVPYLPYLPTYLMHNVGTSILLIFFLFFFLYFFLKKKESSTLALKISNLATS